MVLSSEPHLQTALVEHFCQSTMPAVSDIADNDNATADELVTAAQHVELDGDLAKVTFWLGPKELPLAPTSKEKRRSLHHRKGGQLLCRGISGYIVLYSAESKASLKHATDRLQQIRKHGSPNAGLLLLRCTGTVAGNNHGAASEAFSPAAYANEGRKVADSRMALLLEANLEREESVQQAVMTLLHDCMLRRIYSGSGAPEITTKRVPKAVGIGAGMGMF
jgi:hypothetical protein